MSDIPARLRRQVIQRASQRCEYCGLSQEGQEATFHIDHIVPEIAGGTHTLDNLALACVSCSLRKGARQVVPDPLDGKNAPIYHPRLEQWHTHFQWEDVFVIGLTPTGRASILALDMNRPLILAIRREEVLLGRHLPKP